MSLFKRNQGNLVASATLSSAANIITASGLDLDTDQVYEIVAYIKATSGGSPTIMWQANSDTNPGNYRLQRISADNTTLNSNRLSHYSFGASIQTSQAATIRFTITKQASGYVFGYTSPINYGSIGAMVLRIFAFGYIGTGNLTSFSLVDDSGSSNFDAGTWIKVYKIG